MEGKIMKLENKRNKTITGIVSVCAVLIAAMMIVNIIRAPVPDEQPIKETTATVTTAEKTESTATEITTLESPTTTSVTSTSTPKSPETQPPETLTTSAFRATTPSATTVITLAPVEVPNESISAILEQHDVQIVPSMSHQTSPAPSEQLIPDSTTYIDGQKYAWDPVIGWIRSSGDGCMIIMDVVDYGDRELYEGGW
jgi:cytoskeletal protein RodZ